MPLSTPTRLVSDVRRNVQRAFGDESGVQLEDSDIIMWINDAQDEIVKRNRINKAKSSTVSVAGQPSYDFSTLGVTIMQIEALHYNGSRLPNMSFAEAEEQIIGYGSNPPSNSQPVLWYEWAGAFTLWPAPVTVAAIDIYYTAQPTRVAALTDKLTLPDKYYNDIVAFVLQKAYEMDEDWQGAQLRQQQFDASLSAMGEEERSGQQMTYPGVTVLDFYS